MTTTTLGPRPAPHLISFDARCFEVCGSRSVYVVRLVTGVLAGATLGGAVKRWNKYADAADYARRVGGVVVERDEPVRRRVSWT